MYSYNLKNIVISSLFLTIMIFGSFIFSNSQVFPQSCKIYFVLSYIGFCLLIFINIYFIKSAYDIYLRYKNFEKEEDDDEEAEDDNLINVDKKNVLKITELALNDDTAFMPIFIEHYTTFYKNLVKKHPYLSQNELKFCAFLYLGFSSKEIAGIFKITHRSVQTKKHNLRQKIGIHTSEDLYFSIKKLEYY